MSQKPNDTRANIVAHVMQAGAAGEVDQTELCRAAYRVADEMTRSDNEPVGKTMTPATASRLLNAVAGLSEHAGITRGDSTAELKNVVTPGSTQPGEAKGDKEEKDKDEDVSLADVMGAIDKMPKRMDALEGKRGDNEDSKPLPLAADSNGDSYKARVDAQRRNEARADDWKAMDLFADFQSKADAVASLFGQRAPRPISGERLDAYKRRSVNQWRTLSPTYKDVDLMVLAVADSIAFDAAVGDILKHADAEGRRPTRVPLGYLAERVEQRGGHTYTRFFGAPKSWMNEFMPTGKKVRTIRQIATDGRIEGTLYQKG